jgi:hypothetical protein
MTQEKTFSEDMFTGAWIQKNLSLAQTDKPLKLDRCNQIAATFNEEYAEENPIWYSPHIHWARPGAAPTARTHGASARRWAKYVLKMGEVTQAALNAVNEGRTPPFRYSKDGPVVRLLVKAIPLITGETPTAGNVSQELYRQLRRRPK